jgi:hypothetical protein
MLTNYILQAILEYFIEQTKEGDISFVFVSGHGSRPESKEGPGLISAVDYEVVEGNFSFNFFPYCIIFLMSLIYFIFNL